ncbi:MAG: choice-of-anchor Q domain-containing protein, partial [Rhodanobacteraceae bacterium]
VAAISGSTVTGCGAIGEGVLASGGGIFAKNVFLDKSVVSDNVVVSDVGGLGGGLGMNGAYFIAKYSAISDNSVEGFDLVPMGTAGGVYANVQYTSISNTTISGNTADSAGGAHFTHTVTVVDSTVSANYASNIYGGLLVDGGAVVSSSTIAFNRQGRVSANRPAGIGSDSMQLNSSILAYNMQDNGTELIEVDAGSTDGVISGAKNIILAGSATTTLPGDTSTGCPRLAPLLSNGGLTPTHAILPGSAAMDSGNNVEPVDIDQRGNGFPRVVGSFPDIGAYEWSEGSGEVINRGGFETCD